MHPCTEATVSLFQRYLEIIARAPSDEQGVDPRLSLENLRWMCREAIRDGEALPIDKISRWLGFVQGCLAMRGLISVDEERDISRPLFHSAYRESGITPPEPREHSKD